MTDARVGHEALESLLQATNATSNVGSEVAESLLQATDAPRRIGGEMLQVAVSPNVIQRQVGGMILQVAIPLAGQTGVANDVVSMDDGVSPVYLKLSDGSWQALRTMTDPLA